MFVLMAAVLPPLLSDQPPEVPQRAGFGDRFHYFRGLSGRRYLFWTVPAADLGDFSSAVVILAARASGRRLAAHSITLLDQFGRPEARDRRWPPAAAETLVLVHFLSDTEAERRDLVADLSGPVGTLALAA
jgi:hypothetical protein